MKMRFVSVFVVIVSVRSLVSRLCLSAFSFSAEKQAKAKQAAAAADRQQTASETARPKTGNWILLLLTFLLID